MLTLYIFVSRLSIERYNITGINTFAGEMKEKGLGTPKVSLQFEMSVSGLTRLVKAEAAVEEIVVVQEEVEVDDDEDASDKEKSADDKADEGVKAEEKKEKEEEKKEDETTEDKKEDAKADANETSNDKKKTEEKKKKKTKLVDKVRVRMPSVLLDSRWITDSLDIRRSQT